MRTGHTTTSANRAHQATSPATRRITILTAVAATTATAALVTLNQDNIITGAILLLAATTATLTAGHALAAETTHTTPARATNRAAGVAVSTPNCPTTTPAAVTTRPTTNQPTTNQPSNVRIVPTDNR